MLEILSRIEKQFLSQLRHNINFTFHLKIPPHRKQKRISLPRPKCKCVCVWSSSSINTRAGEHRFEYIIGFASLLRYIRKGALRPKIFHGKILYDIERERGLESKEIFPIPPRRRDRKIFSLIWQILFHHPPTPPLPLLRRRKMNLSHRKNLFCSSSRT